MFVVVRRVMTTRNPQLYTLTVDTSPAASLGYRIRSSGHSSPVLRLIHKFRTDTVSASAVVVAVAAVGVQKIGHNTGPRFGNNTVGIIRPG